jgi:hypothetical protein
MSVINQFINTDNIIIIETLVKNKTFLDDLITHINNLISNIQVQYDRELDSLKDNIKNIFIEEIKTIIKNLSTILSKYFEKRPGTFISMDLDNVWYLSEKKFLPNDKNIMNPYAQNKAISKILTIVCKLIDFLNDFHLNQITDCKKKIQYLKRKLEEEKDNIGIIQFHYMTKQFNKMIGQLELSKEKYIEKFKLVHEISKPVQQYFINMFNSDFANELYLAFTPVSILNIFQSSLYFVDTDDEFLNFIVKFKSWLPSEYRCKYGVSIIKLLKKQDLDIKIKQILRNFNPEPKLLIDDIISMARKSNKDPSILSDITTLQFILAQFKNKINWFELNNEQIVLFVSVELSLISKFNKGEINNDKMYEDILNNLLKLINYTMKYNPGLFESYLVYSIPNTLMTLYDEAYTNHKIMIYLNDIFRSYLSSKLGIYYLASMIELDQIKKLPVSLEQNEKFVLWFNYYKYINDNMDTTDITDPLTSTILVIPYVIPMDNAFIISNICDKNIIESYLWEKKENPFTRSELTIERLKDFNSEEKNILMIKETKTKLNKYISEAKNVL